MADCCLIKKVATVEVYENKNEVRAYGFMAGDRNTPVMEVRFKHLWGESNLSSCKLRWIIVDDVGSLLVGEVPIQSDNTALINLPNELFTGDRRMKVQLTVASCDGDRILNLQQFTDLKVINNLAANEVVEPVYQILINQLYDETQKYLSQLDTLYTSQYGSLENLYVGARASLEEYLIAAENGGNAEFLQGYSPAHFQKVENTINDLIASTKYNVGDVVQVLGYYSSGDGGGHQRIKKPVGYNGADAVIGADGSIWGIVHNGEVNVSWFGVKSDTGNDTQDELNKCFNVATVHRVKLNKGVYLINNKTNDTDGLRPKSDIEIFGIGKETVIKLIPNSFDHCKGFNIWGKENIKIHDMSIIGDRNEHTYNASTNEWGHGISLEGSTGNKTGKPCNNIEIYNVWSDDWIGDGICVWSCDNVNIHDVYCNNNRRQGISHTGGDNFKYNNLYLTNTNGTPPEHGLDIEVETEYNNGYVGNVYTKGNKGGGLLVANGGWGQAIPAEGWLFVIDNLISENDTVSFSFNGNKVSDKINTVVNTIVSKNAKRVVFATDAIFKNSLQINDITVLSSSQDLDKISYVRTDSSTTSYVNINKVKNYAPTPTSNFVNALNSNSNIEIIGNVFRNAFSGYAEKLEINTVRKEITGEIILSTDVFLQKYRVSSTTTLYNMKNLPINFTIDVEVTPGSSLNLVADLGDGSSPIRYLVDGVLSSTGVLNCKNSFTAERIDLNTIGVVFRQIKTTLATQLDTPYHANNMQKLGILDSYHNYLSELHEYEKSQNTQSDSEIMALNVLQPPVIPTEVEAYAKEYNLI